MRKLISISLILILCLSVCIGLTGCGSASVSVYSMLDIDSSFSGSRTVKLVYPLSVSIDSLKDTLLEHDPTGDVEGVAFTYDGVEEDGYHFTLKLSFTDKHQYEEEAGALLGRSTSVFLSRKNTLLTNGTRMTEDFDVRELIAWIVNDTKENSETKNLVFAYDNNTVSIGSETYTTGSTTDINECTGSAIESVTVKTTNKKNALYDRSIAFAIPYNTYSMDEQAIQTYFKSNTLPEAIGAKWFQEGSLMIYTAEFENITIDKLTEATAMLLDTDSVTISYGDISNDSTPLAEGLTFEENIDTFSFIGTNGSFPVLNYSYSLPLNTTYGDGTVFESGRWAAAGAWENDLYTVQLKKGSARLRIPDGIQYSITGIDFSLESLGDSRFRRLTDFWYDKADGSAGAEYALSFFASKGVTGEIVEKDDKLACRVAFEGTTDELTDKLVSVFGSGNFIAYEKKKGVFDLSIKTDLTDYINLSNMLSAGNAACPMTYHVSSDGGDNIVSVSVDGSETAYTEHSKSSMSISNGVAVIRCHGNIPVKSAIAVYLTIGIILLLLTAFIAIKLIKPRRPLFVTSRRQTDPAKPQELPALEEEEFDEPDPEVKSSITQTTTFSIFELNTLVRNKKYVDEINKDIEQRMRAQSLEDQKKDIRARDLEELSRKVYGNGDDEPTEITQELTPLDAVSEDNSSEAARTTLENIIDEEDEPPVAVPDDVDATCEDEEDEELSGGKWDD